MPSSTYIYKCHVGFLIKPKNWRKSNKSHDTSRHLFTSIVPRGPKSGPRMRGKSPPLHAVVLPEFRQKIYFHNLGGIGGTGSRRHTPYVCEYSEVPLLHRSSR